MSERKRRAMLGALVLMAVTSVVIVNTMQLVQRGRPSHLAGQDRACLNYMEQCVPWESYCCDDMTCTNLGKGFCMHGLEHCICQLPFTV